MSVYSFSQIQTYLQCPLKYKFYYIDKIKPEFEENLNLILGKEIHNILENLYKKINNFIIPSLDTIIYEYEKNFLKKTEQIDNIEEKKIFLNRGKHYLINFYKKNYPFKNIKVIGTEIRIYIELNKNIKFQGFIDRLDKYDNDFIITDYKTNKNLPPEDKTLYEEQLTLYALGVKQKYGKYFGKIYGNLEFLHFDIQYKWLITNKQIDNIKEKYLKIINEIENKKIRYNLGEKESFEPNETNNCKFCEYKELCPLFKHFYTDIDHFEIPDNVVRQLVDRYVQISNQKKEIEKELTQIKNTLEKIINKFSIKRIVGNKYYINVSKLNYYKIKNKEKLKKYLEENNLIEKVLDINSSKLKKLIEENNLNLDNLIEKKESLIFRSSNNNFVN